jgi:hypothetical protein
MSFSKDKVKAPLLTFFSNANDFLAVVEPTLVQEETRHRLMLGIAIALKKNPAAYGDRLPLLCAHLDSRGQPVFIAVMTPPFPILVWFEHSLGDGSMRLIANEILDAGWDVPGVNGIAECSERFAPIFAELSKRGLLKEMRSRSYELTQVRFPASLPTGHWQWADQSQAESILKLLLGMQTDLQPVVTTNYTLAQARSFIEAKRVSVWVVDSEPVSMAMSNRPQLKSIGISAVYTPPEHRKKGYAGANVAYLSQTLLDQGFERVNLFTDLANPTSNKIYMEIGYREVCDYQQFKLV